MQSIKKLLIAFAAALINLCKQTNLSKNITFLKVLFEAQQFPKSL